MALSLALISRGPSTPQVADWPSQVAETGEDTKPKDTKLVQPLLPAVAFGSFGASKRRVTESETNETTIELNCFVTISPGVEPNTVTHAVRLEMKKKITHDLTQLVHEGQLHGGLFGRQVKVEEGSDPKLAPVATLGVAWAEDIVAIFMTFIRKAVVAMVSKAFKFTMSFFPKAAQHILVAVAKFPWDFVMKRILGSLYWAFHGNAPRPVSMLELSLAN